MAYLVKINGEVVDAAGKTLTEFLTEANYDLRTIVIERNEEIVSKLKYDETVIKDGDIIEIISFMGGG